MCFQMIFCVMCMCCLYFSFEYQPEPRIKLIDLSNWAAALHGCIGIKTMTAVAVNNRKHTWWECGGRGPFWWPWSHDMGEAETWREGGREGGREDGEAVWWLDPGEGRVGLVLARLPHYSISIFHWWNLSSSVLTDGQTRQQFYLDIWTACWLFKVTNEMWPWLWLQDIRNKLTVAHHQDSTLENRQADCNEVTQWEDTDTPFRRINHHGDPSRICSLSVLWWSPCGLLNILR